ncbi:MAG: response regulator [Planctomycetes bacterium]|nr:response regulator [Planctomycetota bacterium]
MMPKALVVDDDPHILESASDIVNSLGHECDHANSVESARECLDRNDYSYVLLDLEIPVRAGRSFPRIQNGENLLQEIVERTGTQRPPIIVITAHGTDGPELAVDVMKNGAADYVTKPFPTCGPRTLDKSIRQVLAKSGAAVPPPIEPVAVASTMKATAALVKKKFAGGEMAFYADRIELCGVIICAGPRCLRQRKVLDSLRQKRDGKFVAIGSKKLEERIGRGAGPNSVPGLIQTLRKRIIQELASINLDCGRQEVIVRTKQGYQLRDWITVQDGDGKNASDNQGQVKIDVPNQAETDVPNGSSLDDPNVLNDDAAVRRDWIIQQLVQDRKRRAPDIQQKFGCSLKTAKRDLKALKDEGRIEFVGSRRTGYYRLKDSKKPR